MDERAGQPATPRTDAVNTSQGWGTAAGVVLLAIALTASAFYIHKTRYHSPNDTLAPSSEH